MNLSLLSYWGWTLAPLTDSKAFSDWCCGKHEGAASALYLISCCGKQGQGHISCLVLVLQQVRKGPLRPSPIDTAKSKSRAVPARQLQQAGGFQASFPPTKQCGYAQVWGPWVLRKEPVVCEPAAPAV
mmetsp:Transcript_10894/g.32396  ORF Transcript_10894/g.32396 Transcript_10894/m.32396 type:complete len:128 (-) Transcript_10894:362-745(-)